MAQFDPSTIGQIADMVPSKSQSTAKALTLADMMDTVQMNKLRLSGEKQKQADQETVKKVLKGIDLSTPEAGTKAAEALSKAGVSPDTTMKFMKDFQDVQTGKLQSEEEQYKLFGMQMDSVGTAAANLLGEYQQIAGTVPPAQAAMSMQPKYQAALQRLATAKLPNGQPLLNQHMLEQIQQHPTFDPAFLQGVADQSKEARQILNEQLSRRKQDTTESSQAERERHDRAMEGQGQQKIDQNQFEPKESSLMAAMAEAGVAIPTGRSQKIMKQTLGGLLERNPDKSVDQIARLVRAGKLSMAAASTEANVVARREGSSAAAINALNRDGGLYSQLLETGKNVDFGSAKFGNALKLWQQGEVVADPDISEYLNALADTRAEFASVLARGGQVTDSVRIASEHAFPDKMSNAELVRNVDRSKKIAASIQAGNTSVADAIVNGTSMEDALHSGPGTESKQALPSGVTEDDINETMRVRGMTREQVLEKLKSRAR